MWSIMQAMIIVHRTTSSGICLSYPLRDSKIFKGGLTSLIKVNNNCLNYNYYYSG